MSTSVSLKTRDQEPAAYTPYLHAPVIAPCDYPIRFHAHARNVLRMCVGVLTRMYVRTQITWIWWYLIHVRICI